ncbi:MAG: hypothetical protein A3I11_06500 [Elusimicrobia bacterium RIFCSPLOWO2_02_FULL_39_32]|nr:MAG: hypothetical protein A2034_06895 [Elusimicrobia bacterium GWA2_38_7]OGR81215.1 MAG: hypothetical protein A3B80_09110 [Elusimicrobia bacterium RIFCSPHIGHO2_02_FULL_39_36]OGR91767.1 MAG: hypothetical protein A3I11_06500 [Elusimicrobia bacterium RIFCSPLOWO2_02_FULL_39_32]OGR98427.1 MAG: hypothetical protein A3G85_02360 [Elusimicrobia bacterium RIFCSPLOWO2_12_FULL_39_28]
MKFKILTTYTGVRTLEDALNDKNSLKLLWLEILCNDTIDWESYFNIPMVKSAYEKAAIWYRHYRTMIDQNIHRKPLKEVTGEWDPREYRRFVEVLNFVAS